MYTAAYYFEKYVKKLFWYTQVMILVVWLWDMGVFLRLYVYVCVMPCKKPPLCLLIDSILMDFV